MPVTAAATFCATLVDEWARGGVTDAVVAPGSRSTPLALALAAESRLRLHVHHDERSAAFVALGIGKASERPAVLLCTSGTAAAEFHPAVVEAHQAEVPMIVCTADRPPELRDVAAPQTIDQNRLYGSAVRWFCDTGVADSAQSGTWRSIAARAVADATMPVPGPVHLNLPFRDPLVGDAGDLPSARPDGGAWHRAVTATPALDDATLAALASALDTHRGVIVAGEGSGDGGSIQAFAEAVGWPVLADPRSDARHPGPATIAAFDALVRHQPFADAHAPAVVVRLGRPLASKALAQWIARTQPVEVQVGPTPAWIDPEHTTAWRVVADPAAVCGALAERVRGAAGTPWLARWRRAESLAQDAIAAVVDSHGEPTEPGAARATMAALPDGATLVVSSSMPVRDVEWYAAPRAGVRVFANRGANGIDGVTSTAVGVALGTGAPTGLLIGDIAFLHDSNGLLGAAARGIDLTVVVVDNDGGGIFSFLPQATELPGDRFETLFGTPHGVDLADLAAAHGVPCTDVAEAAELRPAVAQAAATGGVRLVRVRTDRDANVKVHDEIHAAVAAAL